MNMPMCVHICMHVSVCISMGISVYMCMSICMHRCAFIKFMDVLVIYLISTYVNCFVFKTYTPLSTV